MKQIHTSDNLLSLVCQLFKKFNKRRKWQLVFLFILMIFSTLTEVISIGAVLPFIAMLTSPEKLYFHPYLKWFNEFFHINSPKQLILPVTIIFIVVVLLAGIIRIILTWISARLTSAIGSEISANVFNHILHQPYIIHVRQNSSEIINTMSFNITAVVFGTILPSITFINSLFLLIAILISLLIIQPIVAFSALITFGILYSIIALFVRGKLKKINQSIIDNQTKTLKILQESLGGIRDMILDGNQELYSNIYRKFDIPLRRSSASYNFITLFPRYSMETLAIIVIAILAFYLTSVSGNISKVLPIIGAIGIGSQRILPVVQQLYTSWVSISSNHKQLFEVLQIVKRNTYFNLPNLAQLPFSRTIVLSNISFRYSDQTPIVLDNIDLTISKGSRVGLLGMTGAGKSTLIDTIMGLLTPTTGKIWIDKIQLGTENIQAWQKNIAHVPQTIFLADTSIAENIALGVPLDLIDYERIKLVSTLSMVNEFVENYSTGYETVVGERGINLSGGQRQRIGIARALYKNASVLILDEATSALDSETEIKIMKSIASLDNQLTIIMIAHRISSLKDCDYILEVKNRKVYRHETREIVNF